MPKKIPFAQYALKDLLVYFVVLGNAALALVIAAFLLNLGWLLAPAGLVFALLAFVVNFFRDPERDIPAEADVLVSPADGTVQDVETLPRGDARNALDEPALRIGIFLSIFNVHVNRAPMAGRVSRVEYRPGSFLPAYDARAASQNESNTIWLEGEENAKTPKTEITTETLRHGVEIEVKNQESELENQKAKIITGGTPVLRVAVKQISGVAARRIVCPAKVGDRLERGQRYGMIKFGSRTELYVPQELVAEVMVKVGSKVQGGADILVRLKGEKQ